MFSPTLVHVNYRISLNIKRNEYFEKHLKENLKSPFIEKEKLESNIVFHNQIFFEFKIHNPEMREKYRYVIMDKTDKLSYFYPNTINTIPYLDGYRVYRQLVNHGET